VVGKATEAIDISVILPIYRQADQLPGIVARTQSALRGLPGRGEVILVLNGSGDHSADVAQRIAGADASVRVVTSTKGWGAAVIAGLSAARGTLLCYTNSARTQAHDLQLALRYGSINELAVVKASRKQRHHFVRRLGSVLYNFECRMLFGLALWDVNGTPKVFHRALLERITLTERGDLIDLELCVLCKERGIPVVEMPVYDNTRISGKATTNLRSAMRLYTKPLMMRRRIVDRPGVGARTRDSTA
jgi:glycosyltransferase involved in cell wall biosynthesis